MGVALSSQSKVRVYFLISIYAFKMRIGYLLRLFFRKVHTTEGLGRHTHWVPLC